MNTCPFLGQDKAPELHVGFSSDRNLCYRTAKPTSILLDQQQKYCLTKDYPTCPVYQDISQLTLPITADHVTAKSKRSIPTKVGVFFCVLVLAGLVTMGWFYRPRLFALAQRPTTPTVTRLPENFVPPSATALPIPTLEITATLYPSATPTSTLAPITSVPLWLETPNNTTPSLLIHQIGPGDNLAFLANRFGTSVAAIRSVNYFLPVPLWEGIPIVIPVNTTDVSSLPAFEVYQVKDRLLTMKDAAFDLNTTPEMLSKYNQIDLNAILPVDSWLLIPRPFPPATGLPLATQDGKIQNDGE